MISKLSKNRPLVAGVAGSVLLYGTYRMFSGKSNAMDAQFQRVRDAHAANPKQIAAKIMCKNEDYFKGLNEDQQKRLLKICASGIENHSSDMGCYANNPGDYDEFEPFFKQVLGDYHNVDLSVTKHENNWELAGMPGLPADGKLDVSKVGVAEPMSMRIRTARNLKKFPLPASMSVEDRKNMENALGPVFDELIKDPAYGGEYVSLTPGHKNNISEERYQELIDQHIMFKDMSADKFLLDAGIASNWPQGRGCYISADKGFIIWVGEEDHMRIMAMKKSFVINDVFDRLKNAINHVENLVPGGCAKSPSYGVVTSCPTNIGTGMRASVHIQCPKLTAGGSDQKAKDICSPLGLSVRGTGGEHTPIDAKGTIDISPRARFCISEAEIACKLFKAVSQMKAAEDQA